MVAVPRVYAPSLVASELTSHTFAAELCWAFDRAHDGRHHKHHSELHTQGMEDSAKGRPTHQRLHSPPEEGARDYNYGTTTDRTTRVHPKRARHSQGENCIGAPTSQRTSRMNDSRTLT